MPARSTLRRDLGSSGDDGDDARGRHRAIDDRPLRRWRTSTGADAGDRHERCRRHRPREHVCRRCPGVRRQDAAARPDRPVAAGAAPTGIAERRSIGVAALAARPAARSTAMLGVATRRRRSSRRSTADTSSDRPTTASADADHAAVATRVMRTRTDARTRRGDRAAQHRTPSGSRRRARSRSCRARTGRRSCLRR